MTTRSSNVNSEKDSQFCLPHTEETAEVLIIVTGGRGKMWFVADAYPEEPWPPEAAMSTQIRPTMRPMQEPMSSMGTKRPDAMALPAAQTAPRKYTTSIVTRAA